MRGARGVARDEGIACHQDVPALKGDMAAGVAGLRQGSRCSGQVERRPRGERAELIAPQAVRSHPPGGHRMVCPLLPQRISGGQRECVSGCDLFRCLAGSVADLIVSTPDWDALRGQQEGCA